MTVPLEHAELWPKGDYLMRFRVFDKVADAGDIRVYMTIRGRARKDMDS